MISASDIAGMFADLVVEPVSRKADICRRAEDAARQFVNEAYAANVASETVLSVRMLSWNDLPAAVNSCLSYPADLGRAQLYAWSAWLQYLEKQRALLCEHTGVNGRPEALEDGPETARKPDRQTIRVRAESSGRARSVRRPSAKDPIRRPTVPSP